MADHQREAMRNRLLRRVDWRFLLANPQPQGIVCFCTGELTEALRQLPVTVVEPGHALAKGGCDLAVLSNPEPAALAGAAAVLRAGGSCYVEWHGPTVPPTRKARRLLEASGFINPVCYVPAPDPIQTASRWIPLNVRGAARHLDRSRPRPRTMLRRIRVFASQLLHHRLRKGGEPAALCAISRTPHGARRDGRAPGRPQDGELGEYLRERWAGWGLGQPPRHLSILLLAGGSHSLNKVVALVFAGDERQPRLAIKYPRSSDAHPGLLREAENLRTLGATSEVPGVPAFVFLESGGPVTALGETPLTGIPFDALVSRGRYLPYARLGTDWLIQLAGKKALVSQSVWEQRLLDPVLADFESSFGPVLDRRLLRESVARLRDVGPMPMIWEQRDFAPWNLLELGPGKLGVLDWESAEPSGLPILDLVYFLTYMALRVDGAAETQEIRASYQRSLDDRSFTGAVASEMIRTYAERLGLDLQSLANLRLMVWMLHSRSEYRRMVADVGGTPNPDALRKSVFLALWEEDLRGAIR